MREDEGQVVTLLRELIDEATAALVTAEAWDDEPEASMLPCPRCGRNRAGQDVDPEARIGGVYVGPGVVDCMDVCAVCYWSWRMRSPESPLTNRQKSALSIAWLKRSGALPREEGD